MIDPTTKLLHQYTYFTNLAANIAVLLIVLHSYFIDCFTGCFSGCLLDFSLGFLTVLYTQSLSFYHKSILPTFYFHSILT